MLCALLDALLPGPLDLPLAATFSVLVLGGNKSLAELLIVAAQ